MNDKSTCSAERCPDITCAKHGHIISHCIHGTPIGEECRKVHSTSDPNWAKETAERMPEIEKMESDGPQPEKVEVLKYARLAIVLEDLEGGTLQDKQIAATIRAKDEEIKRLDKGWKKAKAKVKELEDIIRQGFGILDDTVWSEQWKRWITNAQKALPQEKP